MINFWFAIAMTLLITFITILFDNISGKLICYAKYRKKISSVLEMGLSPEDTKKLVERSHLQLQANENSLDIWGTDIAIVSISIDLTALGIYISNPEYLPFFQKFNSGNINIEIIVWFIVIIFHLLLILCSMLMKHQHLANSNNIDDEFSNRNIKKNWFLQQKYMLSANSIGFISLMSSIIIITNAI